ncbi:hypothetical protein HHL16_19175 [Pseudoflavitalea sp. G-6-1-2]|uniref:hypothetical protein n=1 Tax=Pseudoflavitalea sp. G-6-1-2 TaxID=2728841 RepID=UPI00146BB674|nr:hypothetical protein [Pseudoflavitalea sp. G-6-1-2]NML23008.1 hypothetical protein [Pseudoflavitalea sp. G-6-1-2]
MKKYLIGTLAVVLAIGAAAFTAPTAKATTYVQFVGNPSIMADVQDQVNWEQAVGIPSCDLIVRKACRIQIDDSKLITNPINPMEPKTLDPTKVTSINVSHGIDNVYYVPTNLSGTPGSYTIGNKN